jgi:hypothetical protein
VREGHETRTEVAEVVLVRCPNVQTYAAAQFSERRGENDCGAVSVPLLAPGSLQLAGFPRGAKIEEAVSWRGSILSPDHPTSFHRVCVAAEETVSIVAAQLLCRATGRRLVQVPLQGMSDQIREVLTDPCTSSLVVVVPGWGASGEPDPAAYAATVKALRANADLACRIPLGILTAATPAELSRQVGKCILHREIAAHYAMQPAVILDDYDEPIGPSVVAADTFAAPIVSASGRELGNLRAAGFFDRSWSLLLFRGHGRSYCALNGLLCGARATDAPIAAPLDRCAYLGDCASEAFLQTDCREFDADLVVIDSCDAASWAATGWRHGTPPIAFQLLAGAASAVIAPDAATICRANDHIDILWALRSSATIGEATMRMNARKATLGMWPNYVLLGDPDLPLAGRWNNWLEDDEPSAKPSPPVRPPLRRIRLPVTSCGETFTLPGRGGLAGRFQGPAGNELWQLAGPEAADPVLEPCSASQLIAAAVPAALELQCGSLCWTPLMQAARKQLSDAAEVVLELSKSIAVNQDGLEPGDLRLAARFASDQWVLAHARALDDVVENVAPTGLWPFAMWSVERPRRRIIAQPCPCCGAPQTIELCYETPPAGMRRQIGCFECDLISDLPTDACCALRLTGPAVLRESELGCAEATVSMFEKGAHAAGAAAVLIDGVGHNTMSNGATTLLRFSGSEPDRVSAQFRVGPGARFHRYRLRALAVVNGRWLLASRPVMIAAADG